MFGTAGLPHILMRFFFTVPDASRKSVLGPPPDRLLLRVIFIIGFGAPSRWCRTNPEFADTHKGVIKVMAAEFGPTWAAVLVAKGSWWRDVFFWLHLSGRGICKLPSWLWWQA